LAKSRGVPYKFSNELSCFYVTDNKRIVAVGDFRSPFSILALILNWPENNTLRLRETTKSVTLRTPKTAPLKIPMPIWNSLYGG
jgi:hypothetical protein